MRCPFCNDSDTQVKDSRPVEEQSAIRRRRQCAQCGARFTTVERVQLSEISVYKKNKEREPFDREKLARSIKRAVRKRNLSEEDVDRLINRVVYTLESSGETEIASQTIGTCVLDALRAVDLTAYIRFASVYKDFQQPEDFEALLETLKADMNPSNKTHHSISASRTSEPVLGSSTGVDHS